MTLAQFLAWEEEQELRYEFDGFQPVGMTGGTARHGIIRRALFTALANRLHGRPCEPWGPDEKIEVAGRVRYPDVFVSCTRPEPKATIIPEPVVVFEIISPGTSRTDRIQKVQEYQATASIRRYVILEQDSVGATVFARR